MFQTRFSANIEAGNIKWCKQLKYYHGFEISNKFNKIYLKD